MHRGLPGGFRTDGGGGEGGGRGSASGSVHHAPSLPGTEGQKGNRMDAITWWIRTAIAASSVVDPDPGGQK